MNISYFWERIRLLTLHRRLYSTSSRTHHTPTPSSSPSNSDPSTWSSWFKSRKTFINSFNGSPYPDHAAWSLAELTSNPREQRVLRKAAGFHDIDEFDFLRWRNALTAKNLMEAVKYLSWGPRPILRVPDPSLEKGTPLDRLPIWIWQGRASSLALRVSHTQDSRWAGFPHWIILHLTSKVKSPHEALLCLALVKSQLLTANTETRILLIHRALYQVVRFQVLGAVPRVLDLFLSLPSSNLASYNDILLTLTQLPPSPYAELQIRRVLRVMRQKRVTLDQRTYRILFKQTRMSYSMFRTIQHRMARESFQLDQSPIGLALLTSFAKIAAASGKPSSTRAILRAARHMRKTEQTSFRQLTYRAPRVSVDAPLGISASPLVAPLNNPDDVTLASSFIRARRSHMSHKIASVFDLFDRIDPPATLVPQRSKKLWSMLFIVASRQRSISAHTLVEGLNAFHANGGSLDPSAYAAIVTGLLKRGDVHTPLQIWDKYLFSSGQPLDAVSLSVGVNALAAGGRLLDAFELWDTFARKPPAGDCPGTIRPEAVEIDAGLVNQFISILGAANRADVAYVILDGMEATYGVRYDNSTLYQLLTVSSFASERERAKGMLDRLGWQNPFRKRLSDAERQDLPSHVRSLLHEHDDNHSPREEKSCPGMWWGNQQAWEKARQIFRDVVLGNWPHLARISPPAVAHVAGFPDLFPASSLDPSCVPPVEWHFPLSRLGTYYDLAPTSRSFHAYVRLLCAHDKVHEVPQALAWMKALSIRPSKATLRLALLRFSEVGASAPIEEYIRGDGGEAGKLRRWIEDWVGLKACPTDREVETMRARLRPGQGHTIDSDGHRYKSQRAFPRRYRRGSMSRSTRRFLKRRSKLVQWGEKADLGRFRRRMMDHRSPVIRL